MPLQGWRIGRGIGGAVVPALCMVLQHLDDAAVLDAATPAALDHLLELRLQGLQAANAPVHVLEMAAGDHIDLGAGLLRRVLQVQQRAGGIEAEAEFARMPDERQTRDIALRIETPVAVRPRW